MMMNERRGVEQMERKNVQLELQIASFHLWNSVVSKGDTTILPALIYGAQVLLTILYSNFTKQDTYVYVLLHGKHDQI
jgi:hypothetical protein